MIISLLRSLVNFVFLEGMNEKWKKISNNFLKNVPRKKFPTSFPRKFKK